MQQIPLAEKHRALNAKMVEFAGFEMPVSYVGIVEEHLKVRNGVGIFDVSHMGEFIIKGAKALDLLQYITTNDVSKLEIGQVQYSCMPNGKGGIVDDLLIYRLAEDKCSEGERAYMLVVNASNIEKDWAWIQQNNTFGDAVQMTDISSKTSLLAVQGPKAVAMLQHLTAMDLGAMKYYTFEKGTFAGCENILVSATGYTGAGGFEIYADNSQIETVWNEIWRIGAEYDLQAIGLGARDTLRLEMGFCLYGNDIDDTTSPLEAGLGWITKMKKGDFIDKAYYETQKANGLERKLVGLEIMDKRPARHDYPVTNAQGEVIGKVTSGTKSPSLDKNIAMAYVKTEYAVLDTVVMIDVRGKGVEAKVVKTPFLQNN